MVDAVALINGSDGDDVQMQKPKSATRVVGQVLGGALLLLSGVAIGRQHPASLRGSGLGFISEAFSTRAEFEAGYNTYTHGLSPASLSAANTAIYTAAAPPSPAELIALHEWYKGVAADGVDQHWAQHMMNTAFVNVAVPGAPAAPAKKTPSNQHSCSTSISSYAEFGHCYSHATAGQPWAQIGEVDRQVRGASLPHGSSKEISVLWSWYSLHATDVEKHDFENSALVHMESAGLN